MKAAKLKVDALKDLPVIDTARNLLMLVKPIKSQEQVAYLVKPCMKTISENKSVISYMFNARPVVINGFNLNIKGKGSISVKTFVRNLLAKNSELIKPI